MADYFDQFEEHTAEAPAATGSDDYFSQFEEHAPEAPQPRPMAADPYDAFKESYIAQSQRGPLTRAGDMFKGAVGAAGQLIKTGFGAIPGAMDLYKNSNGGKEIAGNLIQTGVEGAGRGLYDTLNLGRQGAAIAVDSPVKSLLRLNPVGGIISDLTPYTPEEAEIRKAYVRNQTNQAYEGERKGDVIPKLTGKADPKLAEATSLIADPTSLAGGLGLAKAGVKIATKSLEKRAAIIASALNPGMRKAVNQNTAKAIKIITPKIDDMAKEAGIDWSTSKGAADLGHYGKTSTWAKAEALSGQPIVVDPTRAAERAFNVMGGSSPEAKAALMQFPGKQNALLKEITPFLEGPMSAKEMEANLQVLNARNRVAEAMSGVDKASAIKANPVLAAKMELADGLREILDNAMPGYSDLKKEYGAWKNFTNLSEQQAIRQAKLDGNLSLYQGLSFGPAMWSALKGNLVEAAGQLAAGKYAAMRRTPDYAFKKAASPYHSLRDSEGFRNGMTVLATIGGKDFAVVYQGEVGGEKAKIKMQDGKIKTVDLYDLAPAPVDPSAESQEQP